jgi:hypothetical protein
MSSMNVKRVQTIFINSANRVSGDINDFQINLPQSFIRSDDNTQIRLSVVHLSFNKNCLGFSGGSIVVTADDNSNLTVFGTQRQFTLSIPAGYYTVYTFQSLVVTWLNSIETSVAPSSTLTWIMNYISSTNKYSFTPPNDGFKYSFIFNNCGNLFGFSKYSTQWFNNTTGLLSDSPINMDTDTSIFLHTDLPRKHGGALQNIDDVEFKDSTILCAIPNYSCPFQNINIDVSNNFVYYLSTSQINNMRLWLTDQNNNNINLYYDWILALKIEYIEINENDQILQCLQDIKNMLGYITLHPKLNSP